MAYPYCKPTYSLGFGDKVLGFQDCCAVLLEVAIQGSIVVLRQSIPHLVLADKMQGVVEDIWGLPKVEGAFSRVFKVGSRIHWGLYWAGYMCPTVVQ